MTETGNHTLPISFTPPLARGYAGPSTPERWGRRPAPRPRTMTDCDHPSPSLTYRVLRLLKLALAVLASALALYRALL